jgi:predicted O-methyltransferase YrrM
MIELIERDVAAIKTQDPRAPVSERQEGRPFRRMDSPLYRIALGRVAETTQPRRYLEIGVKEGGSLAVVLAASENLDRLVLCDFFTINEKKARHRDVAQAAIEESGFTGDIRWLDGSSTVTVPTLEEMFDLVGVDGSHRRSACEADLRNVEPLVAPGGHIVVDDLTLFEDRRLELVFDAFVDEHSDKWEVAYKNTTHWPGVGVLKRRS